MADTVYHGNVYTRHLRQANVLVRLLLYAFLIVCVFDPADRILGAKVWLFVALWVVTLTICWSANDRLFLPIGLSVCVLLFITIPLLSILWYYLSNGTQPYAGFGLLKGVLLVSIAIVLAVNRVDVLPFLSAVLIVLALLTIAIFAVLQLYPNYFSFLYDFAYWSGVLVLGRRTYGEGLIFTQVIFGASPLLAISISHYFDRAISETGMRAKLLYFALTVISIIGMFLVGLRNNIAVALLLPFFLWPLYTRRVAWNAFVSLCALAILSLPFVGRLRMLLDPAEFSNNIKLTLLGDYAKIFSDPLTLLLGQGLGAYYQWSTSGRPGFEVTGENFYFNTELTYAELIRYFGLVGASIMTALLLFPIVHPFLAAPNVRQRALALGFLAYLCMSATNPLLFSSNGMLFFSVMLANTFQTSDASKYLSIRGLF